MSSYIIAGSANRPETGLCEEIANQIKSYYQNIDFRIIIKHPNEWDNYIHEILRIYGFKKMYDPIVFTLDGKLIGGIEGFKELAQKGFGISEVNDLKTTITPGINTKMVEKEVAAKKKLQKGKKTLQEKVALSLRDKLNEGQISCIEGFYNSYINNGVQFYVKEEHQLCPEITIPNVQNCPVVKQIITEEQLDLASIAANDQFTQETQAEEEQNNSMNKSNKSGEITSAAGKQPDAVQELKQQGTIEAENLAENSKEQSSAQIKDENAPSEQKIEGEQQQQSQTVVNEQDQQSQQQIQQQQLDGDQSKSLIDQTHSQIGDQQAQETTQVLQEEEVVPEEEDLINNVQIDSLNQASHLDLSKTIIKEIKDNYYLAFHPDPLLDGQILLFEQVQKEELPECQEKDQSNLNQSRQQDEDQQQQGETEENKKQEDQEVVEEKPQGNLISDWSKAIKSRRLKKRQSSQKKPKENIEIDNQQQQEENQVLEQQEQTQQKQSDLFKSKLNRDIVQLDKPLSKHDWKRVKKVLKKLECAVTFQILPFGHKNHLPLSNNVLNVYLRSFLTRANKNEGILDVLEDYNKNEQEIEVELLPFEKYILQLQGQAGTVQKVDEEFIKIPNLEFEHVILKFNEKVKTKNLKKKFKQMIRTFYSDDDLMKYGINCIVTKSFMMLVPLRGPYGYFEGNPLYLNPISYLGFIHVPILTKIWPTTAYNQENFMDKKDYIQLLNNQINNTPYSNNPENNNNTAQQN